MNGWQNHRLSGVLVGLAMFLVGTTAVALSCIDSNREVVNYEVVEVRIDGEIVAAHEVAEPAIARGDYDDGISLQIGNDDWSSDLTFRGGAE